VNVFAKAFPEVTFDDVEAFCAQKHPESTTLDYKRQLPNDLAKHFAMFSNTLGGMIIVGVEEDPATGNPLRWEGLANDRRLLERTNQFAANVRPFPSYNARLTNEVNGKVFLLINVLEGDAPPYLTINDPTVRLRTGNVSTPLRQADRDELVRMVEKKNSADEARKNNLATARATFNAGLERAEGQRRRKVAAAEQAGTAPNVSTIPYNIDNSFLTVSLQPFYPKRLLVEPWDIKAAASELLTRSRHGMEMPPLDMEPMPSGLFGLRFSPISGSVKCYQLYGNGLIYYLENVWRKDQQGGKNIYLAHMAFAFYRHLVFARKFYSRFGYSGLLVGEIALDNAINALLHRILPEGYMSWADDHHIDKLSDYRWPLELDTHMLDQGQLVDNYYKETMRRVYWDLGIESVNSEILDKHLEQTAWE
jgi:Schlafen, AlbA_2